MSRLHLKRATGDRDRRTSFRFIPTALVALLFTFAAALSGCERDEAPDFESQVDEIGAELSSLEDEIENAGDEVGDGLRSAYDSAAEEWEALEANLEEAGDEVSESTEEAVADIRARMQRLGERLN